MLDEPNSPPIFEVSIYGRDPAKPKKFDIRFTRQYFDPEQAFFLKDNLCFVVNADWYTFIWQLPATMDDDLKLDVVRYQKTRSHYSTCLHQELYSQYKIDDNQPQHIERRFQNTNVQYFEREIRHMIAIYQVADEASRKAILQYIGPNLNSHYDSDSTGDTFLSTLCHWWVNIWLLYEDESHNKFLSDLLASSASQWILRPDTPQESNPLWILLEAANTRSRVMHLAKILINYCFQNARAERDVGYLFPVLQCLHVFIDPKCPHTDLGAETLERLKYLPVKNREYLIDHHKIAHSPERRLDFWRSNKRLLYRCKDPIVQLANDMEPQGFNENFKREFCVAPFSMLWRNHDNVRIHATPPSKPSWIRIVLSLVWYKCKPSIKKKVECQGYSNDVLNNPALVALIEYKWNVIGFKYYMVRFSTQCCYYALVLTVMFLQVYGSHHGTLFGVFVAIAVLSVIFLWLELIQLIRDWRHYLTSFYNLVDMMVFGLPLAASINHFLILSGTITGQTPDDGNAGLLSFSVLFVFLHFIFELRFSKRICQFVTIIVYAFVEIRMFFFLSAGVIFAYTIAIMHLLHSCPFKMCVEPDPPTNFPTHFYGALSATFFYMAGRYNSVDDEFDSNNWAFQTLMMGYYFFMVVLMLNVLIALINNAFNDGAATWHATWLESRIRVIETVEDISFREHYNWFPDEIYYSVLGKQIEVYQAKELDEWANSTNDGNNSSATLVDNVPKPRSSSKSKVPPMSPTRLPPMSPPRSSHSPNYLFKQRDSTSSATTYTPESGEDVVGAASGRLMNELQGELRQHELRQVQGQIGALQGQMKEMQEMLSAFLETRAASGSSS
ncbi:hypothetical protein BG011_009599 [Mortierella polycephala]|uniref:Ion transport domain-containing protein n=1 Tax=Mortierella polycephala TaxID=41804 RepID=A0A9P6TW44_9FUNG|nr:hypothetical protein BG011_009599 [Mortierella polycephala]